MFILRQGLFSFSCYDSKRAAGAEVHRRPSQDTGPKGYSIPHGVLPSTQTKGKAGWESLHGTCLCMGEEGVSNHIVHHFCIFCFFHQYYYFLPFWPIKLSLSQPSSFPTSASLILSLILLWGGVGCVVFGFCLGLYQDRTTQHREG